MRKLSKILVLVLVLMTVLTTVTALTASAADAGTITVYFENNWKWTDVSCHYWGSSETKWPGKAMTLVEDYNGNQIYSIEIPTGTTGIIFNGIKNDGSNYRDQTPNITKNLVDGYAWKMNWNGKNEAIKSDYAPGVHSHTYVGAEAKCECGEQAILTVVGGGDAEDDASVFGTRWDLESVDNQMTYNAETGRWVSKVYVNNTDATVISNFKVAQDKNWNVCWGAVAMGIDNSDNAYVELPAGATLIISLDYATGKLYADVHVHSYSEATCTTKATCSTCGATTGELAEHSFVEGKCTCGEFDPTYTVVGSLDELKAALVNGGNIILNGDITSSEIIVVGVPAVINGNGHTITSTAGRAINISGANGVTIKNLTVIASGERAFNVIQNATNVVIDNVTATADNYTFNIAGSAPNAVVAIKNSTLTGLCTVNVSAAGANVTVDKSIINCNDNNTTEGEAYAALSLNKDAIGGSIVATNTTINVAEGSDSVKGRNGAENGTVTIDGTTDGVMVIVAVITYEGSDYYHAFASLEAAIKFAKNGDTIKLMSDVTVEKLEHSCQVNIDLNGYTLTAGEKVLVHNYVKGEVVEPTYTAGGYTVYTCSSCGTTENSDFTEKKELPKFPEAVVTPIEGKIDEETTLTFALNFGIKGVSLVDGELVLDPEVITEEYFVAVREAYGKMYVDYRLTIEGLTDTKVVFNAIDEADGFLSGQYDFWSPNWVSVPFEDVEIPNNGSLMIMEYAAEMMGKQGLRYTLEEIVTVVIDFDCGVYFTPEFLAANPDMKVTLELIVFNEDENGNMVDVIEVAENVFTTHTHSWSDPTCTEPAKCECGETQGEALGHTWADATCVAPKTCSVCGATEGEALGHTWADATCIAPKTCSVCGATEGEALGHSFSEGTCGVCGAEDPNYVPPHEHNFVEGKCECGETDPNYEAPVEPQPEEELNFFQKLLAWFIELIKNIVAIFKK